MEQVKSILSKYTQKYMSYMMFSVFESMFVGALVMLAIYLAIPPNMPDGMYIIGFSSAILMSLMYWANLSNFKKKANLKMGDDFLQAVSECEEVSDDSLYWFKARLLTKGYISFQEAKEWFSRESATIDLIKNVSSVGAKALFGRSIVANNRLDIDVRFNGGLVVEKPATVEVSSEVDEDATVAPAWLTNAHPRPPGSVHPH